MVSGEGGESFLLRGRAKKFLRARFLFLEAAALPLSYRAS